VNGRIERLQALIEEPLLVTNPKNVIYLAGFDSSNAALLVDQERVQLFTDFRYIEAARAVEGVEVVQTKRSVIAALAEKLSGPVGFEATNLVYADYRTLKDGGIALRPHQGLVESLRAIKDEGELEILRRACAITDRVFERLTEVKFVGRTEREVSWDLTRLFHEEGGEGLAFESIVGAGPTGARPHARAGDRKIGAGELVVVDAGCTVEGYASDYTRTFATGPLDDEAKEVYAVVLAAQQAGLDAIRGDIPAIDADNAARRVVDESPFAGTFGHGLGHGLGLDVHELPRMGPETEDVLVTQEGIENLTGFRKDLVEVG
jgi:Xaa-Pro aminopeptidase